MEFVDYCSFCGFAITQYERACIFYGEFVDKELNRGVLNATLCSECWNRIYNIEKGGMDEAIKRSSKME